MRLTKQVDILTETPASEASSKLWFLEQAARFAKKQTRRAAKLQKAYCAAPRNEKRATAEAIKRNNERGNKKGTCPITTKEDVLKEMLNSKMRTTGGKNMVPQKMYQIELFFPHTRRISLLLFTE